jgi:exo-1,4-beta-D-glucosaminidase
MAGPYDYVPPNYWLTDQAFGGAHGFNSETSPGPAVPPIEGLREMLPSDRLWPVNSWWDYHAGGGAFAHITTFSNALAARYGPASSAKDYADTSQLIAYEGERAMFEAFGRNKYNATGVIQWMLNNAWPSVIWHLYDYYLRPGGGYFGTRKACEPLHVQYSYDDDSIVVVNSQYRAFRQLNVEAQVYNVDSSLKYSHESAVDIDADGVTKAFVLPSIAKLSSTYFLRLTLRDEAKREISSNFYWLSTQADQLNWKNTTWYYTPQIAFADFHALRNLAAAQLSMTTISETRDGEVHTAVTVKNVGDHIAFFVHLKATRAGSDPGAEARDYREEALPVLWSDNYISLLPGEERRLTADYPAAAGRRNEGEPVIEIEGWNVAAVSKGGSTAAK